MEYLINQMQSNVNDATSDKYDYQVKILMIGESGVGKTCVIQRFTRNEFTLNHLATIAIDFRVKSIDIGGKKLKMQIWDTAGQERFNTLTTSFLKGADGIILCYAINDDKSFENVSKWMLQIKNYAPKDVKIVLIGNKMDLEGERRVAREEGQRVATNYNIPFFECSAKSSVNISELFSKIGEDVVEKLQKADLESSVFNFKHSWRLSNDDPESKGSKCC